MKNLVKNTFYATTWTFLLGLNTLSVSAISVTNTKATTTWDNGTDGDFINTLDTMLGYVVGLLYFIAVVFTLWGWFQILTAGWDEEKVKKWKTTLIQAVIGLILIFLASQIVSWIVGLGATTIK